MADTPKPEQVILKPLEIIAEAWATLRKDWRLYLRWALIPVLPFFLVGLFTSFLPYGWLQHWQQHLALGLYTVLAILFHICYEIRIYRHILCGDASDKIYSLNFFSRRTWLYFWKGFLVFLKFLLFTVIFAIAIAACVAIVLLVMFKVMHIAQPQFFSANFFGILLTFIVGISATLGFMVIAEQYMLIGPDVALDGKASLARLKRLTAQHRMRIFWIGFLIGVIPFLLILGLLASEVLDSMSAAATLGLGGSGSFNDNAQAITEFIAREHRGKYIILNVLEEFFSMAWWIMIVFASAVIYKRLSPTWLVTEAAEQELRGPAGQPVGQSAVRFAPGLLPQSPASPEPGTLPEPKTLPESKTPPQ